MPARSIIPTRSTEAPRTFTIVGGGLGGALMAIYLGREGYEVDLYERRADPRSGKADAGRSINLAISVRGIEALRGVGLAEEVLKQAVPMRGRMIHGVGGDVVYQPYGVHPDQAINSVSRKDLNVTLIEAARAMPSVRVHFDHKCVGVNLETGQARFQVGDDGGSVETSPGVVIGADGAFSAVRGAMQRLDRFDYSQSYLAHGYKELSIPPGADGRHRLERNALHIWPRKSFMMIALPNIDGSFTCTLFWAHEGENSAAAVRTDDEVRGFFNRVFPDAVPHMPTLIEDFRNNPNPSLVTVRCQPWHYRDRVVLLGDAAHAVVPFYGQGANCAFEDCPVLLECLRGSATDPGAAFNEYERRRKRHADALADLAIGNFLEMRDKTGSRVFLLKKKGEKLLHRLLGDAYLPLYSMVSFSTIAYADAVERARRQNRRLGAAAAVVLLLILLLLASA